MLEKAKNKLNKIGKTWSEVDPDAKEMIYVVAGTVMGAGSLLCGFYYLGYLHGRATLAAEALSGFVQEAGKAIAKN